MAVKKGSRKKEPRRLHSPVRAGSKEAAEHAARLTPPEEQNGAQSRQGSKGDDGAIVVDTSKLKLPKGVTEEEQNAPNWFGFDPVVLIILGLSVLFIAFIAYLISTQPAP
ncbi:MAG TPA: hypothetical protein VM911_04530 [Pyrinomonadaceae bacterium]|jgi:hypothetical protein|nr:hypothetical protein [Pyrinomonadaceae bacterium]